MIIKNFVVLTEAIEAVKKYGDRCQIVKTIEEMAELSVQLAKNLNDIETTDIEGEIADVIIMMESMKVIFPKWEDAYERKVSKLKTHLENGTK